MAKSNFSILGSLKAQMTEPPQEDESKDVAVVQPTSPEPAPVIQSRPVAAPPPAPMPIVISPRPAATSTPSRKRRTLTGPTIQINADIPKDLHREMRMLLVVEDRSFADLLESLLREYVQRAKGK
jgi:hypothetical protein